MKDSSRERAHTFLSLIIKINGLPNETRYQRKFYL